MTKHNIPEDWNCNDRLRYQSFLLPTDAQENCFKRSIKIYRFWTVQQTHTSKDLTTYAATTPD